ncbi:NUDIX hydrolase [Tessaracoccus sp. Y36]|uniref:NUDIX hydrolase n=1 Tax=Tessaracoccus sp. ZS01 TaxID=1906324 RepID=UPI00096C8BBC|nr:8-oxo-dGTP diphosphatase [Tessaracoccus sp. ZS01]MCG6566766.1 8-oxo-dGTP diphosphatase [Tessaracoccus sp. ZS01]OMG57911.1 7,8-dihydro-8-oxoguanine triphosphatase [Tessaracoccus sp. ZS01]
MPFAPELTTLGYVTSPDRTQVLLCHRVARSHDEQLGKYNGLGGKVERGEDVAEAMRRELREEANIEVTEMELRGTVAWPGFNGRDVFGFVFLITGFTGSIPDSNVEGDLGWHDVATMMELPMWDGDRHFLPLVFDDGPQFHGVIPYDGGHSVGWKVSRGAR